MDRRCYWPTQGMTIDPLGYVNMCCTSKTKGPHIDELPSLLDYFISDTYLEAREDFKVEEGYSKYKGCAGCHVNMFQNQPSYPAIFHLGRRYYKTYGSGFNYLELSTSNICNQSCVTCSSYFSSKWKKLEHLFHRKANKSFSHSKTNIDKIIEVLPYLKQLMLKGGEPFADQRNLRILKELFAVNNKCHIDICSNMQEISKGFRTLIEKYANNFSFTASIDGIGSNHNWIRGGDFNKSIRNMEELYAACGVKFSITPVMSIYNIKQLREIYDFFIDKPYAYIKYDNINIVTTPRWSSVLYLLDQEEYDDIINEQFHDMPVKRLTSLKCSKEKHWHDLYLKNTNTMDKIRGFTFL
jgi:hypothetical protein